MITTAAKLHLIQKEEELSLPPVTEPYKIIPLINSAWGESFGRVRTNKVAIEARG